MRYFGDTTVDNADPLLSPILQWPAGRVLTWDTPYPNFKAEDGNTYYTASIQPYVRLVQRALDLWQAVSGITFAPRRDVTSPTADIQFGFDNIPPPNGKGLAFGLTTQAPKIVVPRGFSQEVVRIEDPKTLPLKPLSDGDSQYYVTSIKFSVQGPIVSNTLEPATLFNTIVHEIGHALGLAHNLTDPFSIMYSSNTAAPIYSLDVNDVRAIQTLYPRTTPLQALVMTPSVEPPRLIMNDATTLFNPFNVTDIPGLGMQIQITESGVGGVIKDIDPNASTDPNAASHWSFDQTKGVFTEIGVDAISYNDSGLKNWATYVLRHITYTPPASGGKETFTITVTDSLGRIATSTTSVTSNPSPSYHAPATQPVTPAASTAALPSTAAAVDPNVVTIPLGSSLTATISPSMQLLPPSSPLAHDVQTLEASSSITDFGAGLKTLFADVRAADLTAAWSGMSVPQPSQTLTITDHGSAVLGLHLSGTANDPTAASALALFSSLNT